MSATATSSLHHATVTAARVLIAPMLLVASVGVAPQPAFASKSGSDRVAGARLSSVGTLRSKAPDINAGSGVLVDAEGRVLWDRGATKRRAMASTTKVMTALIVLENAKLDETVRVSKGAAKVGYATGLKPGEKRPVRKLLELALVASSNDAAAALAAHVGGSQRGFAEMMNKRADELGMEDTHYANPHGLDARGHYSSAADVSILMREAMTHREFRRIVKMRKVWLPGYRGRDGRVLKSTDKLLGVAPGLMGGKTGYTSNARFSFVGSARREGMTLTSVVLGAPTSAARFSSAKALLDWGYRHYRTERLTTEGEPAGAVPLTQNPARTLEVRAATTVSAPVFGLAGRPEHVPTLPKTVDLPVFAGQQVGTLTVTQADQELATVPLVATASIASAEETLAALPVDGYASRRVTVRAAQSDAEVPAYDASRPVKRLVDLPDSVRAPVKAGQRLGEVRYVQDGTVLVRVPAIAAQSIDTPNAWNRFGAILLNGWDRS